MTARHHKSQGKNMTTSVAMDLKSTMKGIAAQSRQLVAAWQKQAEDMQEIAAQAVAQNTELRQQLDEAKKTARKDALKEAWKFIVDGAGTLGLDSLDFQELKEGFTEMLNGEP